MSGDGKELRKLKLQKRLNDCGLALKETIEAISQYKESPVPKGLYVYRNSLDAEITNINKLLKHGTY